MTRNTGLCDYCGRRYPMLPNAKDEEVLIHHGPWKEYLLCLGSGTAPRQGTARPMKEA